MPENVDPTWLAWRLERPPEPSLLEAALDRVERHYARLVEYPLARSACAAGGVGVAAIGDAEPRGAWPRYAEDGQLAIATAYAPTGWERLCGEADPRRAPLPLARALLDRPEAAPALNAPSVLGVVDRGAETLIVAGDMIGAGRLYEMPFAGGTAWSNRAGALPLFAGTAPAADERGWLLVAAAGWALGDSTPLAGVRKAGAGALIRASAAGIERLGGEGAAHLFDAGGEDPRILATEAAERAREQAGAAGRLWPEIAEVDLSGGRDSRVVAAAAIAAGIELRLHTSDVNPGEADVARELVAAAPRPLEHEVRRSSDEEVAPRETPLIERSLNVHLLHDGLRHPQKLRGEVALPRRRPPRGATLSGHGGEIAHGFFYKDRKQARRLRRGGDAALAERVMRFFAKGRAMARPEAYREAERELEASFARGRELGLDGPALLDYFYLFDRFAHRSGIGADAERVSVFTPPEFVRAAFALTPKQRVDARLHAAMIERLVPEWSRVPFYAGERSAMPRVRRLRLWESRADTEAVESLLRDGGSWEEIYDAGEARSAWAELRGGGGAARWESAFEGIAYRAGFDQYLQVIAAGAAEGEPLAAQTG